MHINLWGRVKSPVIIPVDCNIIYLKPEREYLVYLYSALRFAFTWTGDIKTYEVDGRYRSFLLI